MGTATEYHTVQDHLKAKLAYDFSSTVRASYTLGYWQNKSEGRPQSYLTDVTQPQLARAEVQHTLSELP